MDSTTATGGFHCSHCTPSFLGIKGFCCHDAVLFLLAGIDQMKDFRRVVSPLFVPWFVLECA